MIHSALQAKKRTVLGNQVRKLRRDGILPCVIYSKKLSPICVELVQGEFNRVYKIAGKNHVIDLKLEKKTYPCIVHDVDIHPVTGVVRHVDFLSVDLKQKVTASVPVSYIGESKAVKELGGILNTLIDELEVSALPDEIPSEIVVDVSKIEQFGDLIRIQDLQQDSSYVFEGDADTVLVSVTAASVEEEVEAEAVETPVETNSETKPTE
jgi:large subunit ribosomal protein L25